MKCDIVFTGIEGQGVRSAATILTAAAIGSGLHAVRSEVRRVPERPEAIVVHVRVADEPFDERLCGTAASVDIVLSLEPREAQRQIRRLSPSSAVISATEPIGGDCGDVNDLLWSILQLRAGFLVEARRLAEQAGAAIAANAALLGAAADFLPIDPEQIRHAVNAELLPKGLRAAEISLGAFDAGRKTLRHREVVDEFDTFATFSR